MCLFVYVNFCASENPYFRIYINAINDDSAVAVVAKHQKCSNRAFWDALRISPVELLRRLVRGAASALTMKTPPPIGWWWQPAAHLYAVGATDAVPETIEASLQLSEAVPIDLGIAMGPVIATIHEKRDAMRAEIRAMTPGATVRPPGRQRLSDRLTRPE
jgi:hypothetical protein